MTLDEAKEELKRVDHLVYITLKYTRTCDVIKNTIHRLINAIEFATSEALEHARKKKKIKIVSKISKIKIDTLKDVYKIKVRDYIALYNLLKQIDKAEFSKREEYRKNVTLISMLKPGEFYEVNTDKLKEFFYKTKEFIDLVGNLVKK